MSTLELENIKHADASSNAIELASDGSLELKGDLNEKITYTGSGSQGFEVNPTTRDAWITYNPTGTPAHGRKAWIGQDSGGDFEIWPTDTQLAMSINSSGYVGINTGSPAEMLHVNGETQIGSTVHIRGTSTHQGLGFNRDTSDGSIYNSSIGAFQMQNNNGIFEIQRYDGSGTFQDYPMQTTSAGKVKVGGCLVNRGLRRFEGEFSVGNSTLTQRIAVYSRHWWGSGNMRVHLYDMYYGPNSYYRMYSIDGHTRVSHSGGAPTATLRTDHGGHCSVTVSNWDSTNQRANINVYVPNYRRTYVVIEIEDGVADTVNMPTNAANKVYIDPAMTEII